MGPIEGPNDRQPLPNRRCPKCGKRLIDAGLGRIGTARKWTRCLRRCNRCWVGFSNAREDPTIIFGKPTDNVPEEVRDGAIEMLGKSLNIVNRGSKKTKFGYSTSEDALTWTVFRFLHESGQLLDALRAVNLPIPGAVVHPKALLFWGVPVSFDPLAQGEGWGLREWLEAISDQFGEEPQSRTEPDVVIDLGAHGIVIIEVKHRSGIEHEGNHPGWNLYLPADGPLPYAQAMRETGCYELTRNWLFGLNLSAGGERPFMLACLGSGDLFVNRNDERLRLFEACLPEEGTARFHRLRWEDLLEAVDEPPPWFMEYVGSRGYPY